MSESTIVLRRSRYADAADIRRVTERDGATAPDGDVIVAEVDGKIRAWIEPATGRFAADPFHPTAALVEMLELRAAQLRPTARPGGGAARVVFRRLRRAAVATSG